MLQVSKYKCEVCGKLYASSYDAESCEGSHLKPKAIRNLEFQKHEGVEILEPAMVIKDSYPESVELEFSNGQTRKYWIREW